MTHSHLRLSSALGAFALSVAALPALGQTRTLETSFGDVEIPVAPTRVITTHTVATLPLVELGVIPVGASAAIERQTAPHIWEIFEDIPVVATGAERNIEAILMLEPDLILEHNMASDDVFQRLREIGPVVTVGISGDDRTNWQNRARQIADAVGALDRWQELEDRLAARQAEIAERYGDFLADNPITVWSSWDASSPAIYSSQSTAGPVLLPAGAVFAEGGEALPYENSETQISLEEIGTVMGDAAIVFYATDHRGEPVEAVAETRELDVYQRVPAVAQGREFPLGTVSIAGYTNALYLLDSFEAALEELVAQGQ